MLVARHQCRQDDVGSTLPALIRDVHTSLAVGRDVAELLDLAVLLHGQNANHWLRETGAPLDLRWQNDVMLARQFAEDRDTPAALGLATHGAMSVMLTAGVFDLAEAELAAIDAPTTPESTQLAGMLALSHSLVAAVDSRPANADAALEHATELAQRTGEGTPPTGSGSVPPTWACRACRRCWKSGTTSGSWRSRRV
jgi:hypothetical protein